MIDLLSQSRKGLALLFSSFLMLCSSVVEAGTFSVSPVRVTLSAKQKVSSLTIVNQGAETTTVQLELLEWSQDAEGKDVFSPTKDILANPPVLTLAPNAKQVIRLGLRKPPSGSQEGSYRLFLQEVPPPPKEGFMGLNVALRMSLPVFVLPPALIKPNVAWRLQNQDGQLILHAHNQALAHLQMLSFDIVPENQSALPKQTAVAYLLPQQKRQWQIKEHSLPVGTKVMLKAQTDAGALDTALIVE